VRFHHTNILETAGDNSLLVGGSTEVQVNLSVPKDIHNSNGQGRCRDGTGTVQLTSTITKVLASKKFGTEK